MTEKEKKYIETWEKIEQNKKSYIFKLYSLWFIIYMIIMPVNNLIFKSEISLSNLINQYKGINLLANITGAIIGGIVFLIIFWYMSKKKYIKIINKYND